MIAARRSTLPFHLSNQWRPFLTRLNPSVLWQSSIHASTFADRRHKQELRKFFESAVRGVCDVSRGLSFALEFVCLHPNGTWMSAFSLECFEKCLKSGTKSRDANAFLEICPSVEQM